MWRFEWKLPEEYGVDEAEDRRVGSDTESKGQDGREGKSGALDQVAPGVTEVSPERVQNRIASTANGFGILTRQLGPPFLLRKNIRRDCSYCLNV